MRRSSKNSSNPSPLPAHETKDVSLLSYPFLSTTFSLKQLNDGRGNGTGLWLGSQCLSLYLADIEKRELLRSFKTRRKISGEPAQGSAPRAIELGSGIGLGALALASSGWNVLATDISLIVDAVLKPNVTSNPQPGIVQARELDWGVVPSTWIWDDPDSITSTGIKSSETSGKPAHFKPPSDADMTSISPPFDLIFTSDTIFSAELAPHLLRTIQHLARISGLSGSKVERVSYPPAYLALENRDPLLVEKTLRQANEVWGFEVSRVPHSKVNSAMRKGGVNWEDEEWEGVEIWKLQLVSRP
ncbi:hypothetical protein FS837_010133 [Tulasnella sp. UAMH 9824]|nr:hypothetical protein FS837_010133 [Tulasnella sp. UAMH 9824]